MGCIKPESATPISLMPAWIRGTGGGEGPISLARFFSYRPTSHIFP